MKCNVCGADSSVLDTRAYKDVLLRRRRRCFNDHVFHTYEVFSGNLDRRTLADTRRGIQARVAAVKRNRSILARPGVSATVLAAEFGVTEARVRQIRAGARP